MTGIERVFSVVPRVKDLSRGVEVTERTIDWSDAAGIDGVLHFAGAGAVLDPFIAASVTCARSRRLIPFIALNPAHQHPATAARAISSLAQVYGRPAALNLITGTSLTEMAQLGQTVEHDERYVRLVEYAEIVTSLLGSVRPLTYRGRHFQVEKLQLLPSMLPELQPQLYLAGASPAAVAAADQLRAESVGMLPATLAGRVPAAVHFGLVVREERDEAWAAARAALPMDAEGRQVTRASMLSTDSVWKRELVEAAESPAALPGYWLDPFLGGSVDCPYVVGSREDVASLFSTLAAAGVRSLLIDVPMSEEDHAEMTTTMTMIQRTSG